MTHKILFLKDYSILGKQAGEVHSFEGGIFNSPAAIAISTSHAVAVPPLPSIPYVLTHEAFEYLMVRAGILPEHESRPLQRAIKGA